MEVPQPTFEWASCRNGEGVRAAENGTAGGATARPTSSIPDFKELSAGFNHLQTTTPLNLVATAMVSTASLFAPLLDALMPSK
jgi:hypothetical protein